MKQLLPQEINSLKILVIKILSIIFILQALVSCSRPESDNTLRMNLGTEPLSLDWNLANDYVSFDIISNLMIGLTRFALDNNGHIISMPACAKSWTISEDNKEYVFNLNPDIKWTDGSPVIAQHFIDSFVRILDPQTAAPYSALLSIIDLNKTYAIDDYTLKISLKKPAAYFIDLTSYGLTLPIRKDLIEQYGKNWTEPNNLVSNGPFTLKQWQHEYKIVLERNPLWKDNLSSTELEKSNLVQTLKYFMIPEQASAFTLFKNDQLDWVDNRSIPLSEIPSEEVINNKALQKNLNLDIQKVLLLRNTYIGFNHQNGPMTNHKLRKALSYAIDRKTLTKIRSKGDFPNTTFIPPSLGQYLDYSELIKSFEDSYRIKTTKEEYLNGYFPDLARKLLIEAGYKNPKELPELKFYVPNNESSKILAETLQAMWAKELGIKVKISTLEWKVFLNKLRDNPPDLFRLNWGADYPDPDSFMQLFTSSNQINYGKFFDPDYDDLINQASALNDKTIRQKLYTQAEIKLSLEKMAIAPLFIDSQIIMKKPHIKNLLLNPMDIVFLDQVELLPTKPNT
jgi:oligopeptide transport system substrate-binding protein